MKYQAISPVLAGLHHAIATAMLMPFLALCLISPAAMLGRDSSGSLTMVLCTGDGPVEMTVDLGPGTAKAKQRCDWAAAHATVLETTSFPPLAAGLTYHRTASSPATALWHPAYDPRNLWARGPPTLV